MSVRIPECNVTLRGNTGLRLPVVGGTKAANTAAVVGCFFQTPVGGYEENVPRNLWTRADGGTGGSDAYVRVTREGDSIGAFLRNGGTTYVSTTITGLTPGLPYLVLFIINPLRCHVVACTPGGTPIVSTTETTGPYTVNMTSTPLINAAIGANTLITIHYGPFEEFFYLNGEFPEVSTAPDSTLVESIADGSLDIADLAAELTTGVNRFRYRLQHELDLDDAFGNFATLVPTNVDRNAGIALYTSGPLRPKALMPDATSDTISQVVFATAGDSNTATADINIEGGTYTGITPTKIQARLIDETNASVVDWADVDAAPAGGAWAGTTFADVPMTASYLRTEFRAVDGVGDPIGETSFSYGVKGSGFRVLTQAQSQLMYLFLNGAGLALPSGARFICIRQAEALAFAGMLSTSNSNNRGAVRGIRTLVTEINTRFPGVPIQIDSVGQAGTPISNFYPPGSMAGRWASMNTFNGVLQPFYLLLMGHSEDTGSDYESKVASLVTHAETQYGQSIKNLHVPVSRYHLGGAADSGQALSLIQSREGARSYCVANPTRNKWMGSWATVKTSESGSDPHPSDDAEGQGRSGAMLGLAIMSACRAIVDEPLEFKTATASGTTDVVLKLGKVNQSLI